MLKFTFQSCSEANTSLKAKNKLNHLQQNFFQAKMQITAAEKATNWQTFFYYERIRYGIIFSKYLILENFLQPSSNYKTNGKNKYFWYIHLFHRCD